MNQLSKRKAIRLSILFAISYCAVGFFGSLTTVHNLIQQGESAAPTIFGGYHILLLVTIPLYFLPLAIRIRKLAKEAGMKILRVISLFVIISFSVFIFFNIIIVIVYFVNPSFFA